jgi:hypothetical protein
VREGEENGIMRKKNKRRTGCVEKQNDIWKGTQKKGRQAEIE